MTRLVIANRGEIARRILRTARSMGLEVAVISTVEDREALVRQEADAVLEVADFLDGTAIVEAAMGWGAELLHPGYGFLSERADFAEAVEGAGIAFVGPTPTSMRLLGAKEPAKELAKAHGVPVVEGLSSQELSGHPASDWESLLAGKGVQAPYLVKASGGGGGRGMRVVAKASELPETLKLAAAEADAAFGDGTVFVERWIAEARHLEAQVFGDGKGGGVFLGERECSLQRRHQKVLEESPASGDDPVLRESLGRAALALVRAAEYRGAGTVEFLVAPDGSFHFLEVNARLQVEHPVTEAVTGLDLVQAQLELALGKWMFGLGDPTRFHMPRLRGAAVEVRLLAEDPARGFLPTPGRLSLVQFPTGEGIRVDTGVVSGGLVNGRYDSLIAKVIAWGRDRAEALERLDLALSETTLHGCTTNLGFLGDLVRHPAVKAGQFHTRWLEGEMPSFTLGPSPGRVPSALQELLNSAPFAEVLSRALAGQGFPASAPAERFARLSDPSLQPQSEGGTPWFRLRSLDGPHRFELDLGGETRSIWLSRRDRETLELSWRGGSHLLADPLARRAQARVGDLDSDEVRAPMAGRVVSLEVEVGAAVEAGQALLILESMKMRFEVAAPRDGILAQWLVTEGQILGGPDSVAMLNSSSMS